MYWVSGLTTDLSYSIQNNVKAYPVGSGNVDEVSEVDLKPATEVEYNPLSGALTKSGMSVINGPRTNRHIYYISLAIMFGAGSGSDFLAKLVYQFIPPDVSQQVFLWMAWLITLGAFLICIFAIFNGMESFKLLTWGYFFKIMVPALCDVFVSGGRYVALVFLPASIVSVLKNGLQLVFLAMIRGILSQYITKWQYAGITILWIGLALTCVEDVLQLNHPSTWYGLLLMFFVGLFGAIRNSIEEFLLKKQGFHPDFILGFEGMISFTVMVIIGFISLFSTIPTDEFHEIPGAVGTFFKAYPGCIICIVIFMFVLVTKKSMQFHVTKMSSAMTRKLFQQFYPIGVWIYVLIAYYCVDPKFGEAWDNYQFIRILGIGFVILGTFVYLKPEWFQGCKIKWCGRGTGNLAQEV
eukprot:305007_1